MTSDRQRSGSQVNDATEGDIQMLERISEAVTEGITLKEVHGISNEMMDSLYAYAYDFYGKGQLAEAETFFRFLCIYDFYNIDYLMGLAAVYQMKKQYAKAIGMYAVAFAQAKNDYRPMFFTGQCHLFERKAAKARQCFELVVAFGTDAGFKAKAQAYLDVLPKQDASPEAADVENPSPFGNVGESAGFSMPEFASAAAEESSRKAPG